MHGVQVLGCLANADPMAGAGARLAAPGLYTGADFTACIRFQFLRLARTTVVMRVDHGVIRPLLQLGERRRLCIDLISAILLADIANRIALN